VGEVLYLFLWVDLRDWVTKIVGLRSDLENSTRGAQKNTNDCARRKSRLTLVGG